MSIIDNVLLWIHARRLGLTGDGQVGTGSALVMDGKVIASSRTPPRVLVLGSNGAGPVTVAGAVVGDAVEDVFDLTTLAEVTSSFESTVTVAGQVQQTAVTDLSAKKLQFFLRPGS